MDYLPENSGPYLKWTGIIVLIVIVFLLIQYVVYLYGNKNINEPMLIPGPTNISSLSKPFSGNLLPMSKNGAEFAYSFWIMINDWNFNYGKPKCIFFRSTENVNDFTIAAPSVWLYPNENKLMVRVSTLQGDVEYDNVTFAGAKNGGGGSCNPKFSGKTPSTTTACDISNIPLQKWVHVTVSMWNRLLDIYMNGKLVRSCVLPGVPVTDASKLAYLHVGRGDTYNGYISRLKYYNRAVTAAEVYDTYVEGPLPPSYWLTDLMNKVQIVMNVN